MPASTVVGDRRVTLDTGHTVVGPSAERVQSVSAAVPPLSLTTVFNNVSCAAWSLLVMVQVALAPTARTGRR